MNQGKEKDSFLTKSQVIIPYNYGSINSAAEKNGFSLLTDARMERLNSIDQLCQASEQYSITPSIRYTATGYSQCVGVLMDPTCATRSAGPMPRRRAPILGPQSVYWHMQCSSAAAVACDSTKGQRPSP